MKVVCNERGQALYFSRARIPFTADHGDGRAEREGPSCWQHLGLYAYTKPGLARWVAASPTDLERWERLEQLRALYLGMTIEWRGSRSRPSPGSIRWMIWLAPSTIGPPLRQGTRTR